MKFEIETTIENMQIENNGMYGVYHGSDDVLLIIPGAGSSALGYENKYEAIGRIAYEKGYTVVSAAGVSDGNMLADVIEYVHTKTNSPKIKVFAVSLGAGVAAINAFKYPEIDSMLLVNCPLMINWVKVRDGIKSFTGNVITVFGSLDPSYKYSDLIKVTLPYVDLAIIEGADHQFKNKLCAFIDLVNIPGYL